MAQNKKQHLDNAFQRHIDMGKALGGVLMTLAAIFLAIVFAFVDDYNINKLNFIFGGIIVIIVGLIILLWYMSRQDLADQLNERLYAVWHYQPKTIYKFYKILAKKKKRVHFYNALAATAILLILSILFHRKSETLNLSYITFAFTLISALVTIFVYPYSQYWMLVARNALLGDAKEVIFSRLGIWYCGKVYNFGKMGITYHKVERKELYGIDTIVFSYIRKLGSQVTPKELAIPVAPKMAYAADALVEEFNRSDILSKN